MCGEIICIAAVMLGIEVGWRPLPEGGLEYLIQIEPQTLEALRAGQAVGSDLPPPVRDVRAYRITVGTGKLPREAPQQTTPQAAGPQKTTSSKPATGSPTDPFAAGHPAPATGPQLPAPGPQPPATPSGWPAAGSSAITAQPIPRTLAPEPAGKPLAEQRAVFLEPAGTAQSQPVAVANPSAPQAAASRPWLVLTLALLGLSASLAWNVYLLWMVYEARRRYRSLVSRVAEGAAPGAGLHAASASSASPSYSSPRDSSSPSDASSQR